jgi:ubiquinone/menaquinone biosynthesis C-methylase UbiE
MPEFYDRFLVPMMFEPFARHLAQCLRGMTSGHLLEVAAGTGVVTRSLVQTLPPSVAITATDLNPAMLAWAKTHSGMSRVVWQEANALALPFPHDVFDKVVCQFGVMFFPDKQAAYREILRVLHPGGEFLFTVWGKREGTVNQLSSQVVGRFLDRDPNSLLAPPYDDTEAISADLASAGFDKILVEELHERGLSSSARQAAIATCHGGLLRSHIEALAPERLDEITNLVTDAIAAKFGNGPIDAPLHAILFACLRGHEPR